MRIRLGRHVFGFAAILFGIVTLFWHDFNTWQQIRPLGNLPHSEILAYVVAAIEILGGLAIQWSKTARAGAIALGSIFLVFALLWVPRIIAEPRVFDGYGNFFEQFSQVTGALIVYGTTGRSDSKTSIEGGLDRIHFFRNLCCFLHTRTAHISLCDGGLCSKMDSPRTNVLGDNDHDSVRARGYCLTFWAFSPLGISITNRDVDGFRVVGMVACAFCRSAQADQLGRERGESGNSRSSVGCRRFSRRHHSTWECIC